MPANVDTMMYVGETPWHRLGRRIESAATSSEAIKGAGLAWHVEQFPVRAFNPDTNDEFGCPNTLANVRTDTNSVLGVVSKSYRVFQNAEAFDFMDAIVGDKLAMYETAGSLRGGRRVWMLARIPTEYRAGPDDLIKPYILLVNSHDGSSSIRMIATTIRVVCQNTVNLALRQAGSEGLAISHHANLELRVAEARQKLGIITARFDQFDQELHAMLEAMPTAKQADDYFQSLLPAATSERERKNRDGVIGQFHANFDNDKNTLPGMKHTTWALYNAVSEWTDHQRRFRGNSDLARVENRLNSIWFGTSHRIKQHAYQAALELAKAH